MLPIGLNHMTVPSASATALMDIAQALGCVGVELRNDLGAPLFDGQSAAAIGAAAKARGMRILALAEVYGFNDNTDASRKAVHDLALQARECGAEAIALIPRVFEAPLARPRQRQLLREALIALQTVLETTGQVGLIEPLGFENSSLRFKEDVAEVLDDLGGPACFGMIHDTFHHALAQETSVFADLTQAVHISGVADRRVALNDMTDAHRGLVDAGDRLGNLQQIAALQAQGYTGAYSFEAFAPDVHALNDPAAALSASIAFITAQGASMVA